MAGWFPFFLDDAEAYLSQTGQIGRDALGDTNGLLLLQPQFRPTARHRIRCVQPHHRRGRRESARRRGWAERPVAARDGSPVAGTCGEGAPRPTRQNTMTPRPGLPLSKSANAQLISSSAYLRAMSGSSWSLPFKYRSASIGMSRRRLVPP